MLGRATFIAALLGSVAPIATTHAMAQSASASMESRALDEVVVTARKRTESLQDVPVAVAAIPAALLQNNAASDLTKVAELAPQVMIGRFVTGAGAVITIRGISSLPSDPGFDQSVAAVVDGVPLSRGRIIGAAVFDMEQVEILQGPQALFFGKNSPAGVISMRSNNPTGEFEGSVRAGYEFNAREKFLEGVISGPLTDTLRGRLAVRGDWMDGWIRNSATSMPDPFRPSVMLPGATAGRNSPAGHDYAARMTLLWDPVDDFSAALKVTWNKQTQNSIGATAEAFCLNPNATPTGSGVPLVGADCKIDRQKAESSSPPEYAAGTPYGNNGVPYLDSELLLGSLVLTKEFDNLSLTSTTGYYDQVIAGSYSADFSPYTQIYVAEHESYRVINQELRLNTDFDGPLNVMVGAYGEVADRHWMNSPDLFHVFDPIHNSYLTNIESTDSRNKSFSVFAQASWKITSAVELAGGARYTKDDKVTSLVNLQNNLSSAVGRTLYPEGQVLRSHYKNSDVSPEITLTWHPGERQTVYGAFKTGYKAGAISNAALLPAAATPENVQVGPESSKGFEVGYKADLFDRTLRVSLTAYRYRYNGLQVVFRDTNAFRFIVGNAAASRTQGVLGAFEWRATQDLTFNGNFGVNRARYISFANAQCFSGQTVAQGCVNGSQDLSGHTLTRAPKINASAGFDYRLDLDGDWRADFSGSASYSSKYQTAPDEAAGGLQKAYWRINAAVHLSPENERFRFSIIGRNLTNTYYKVATFVHPGAGNINQFVSLFNRPREVIAQVEYKF